MKLTAFNPLSVWLLCSMLVSGPGHGADADKRVTIVAYINQSSGCQTATEAFLKQLTKQFPGRVDIEYVDFGGKGLTRFKRDGMHCMGIKLNGETAHNVVYRGVTVPVRFEMPAGYQWTHDELAIAVRQALDGVSLQDKTPPGVTVKTGDASSTLLIDGSPVLELPDTERVQALATVLQNAQPRAIVREDFALTGGPDQVQLRFRGSAALDLTAEDATREHVALTELAVRSFRSIAGQFPVLTRPFPEARQPNRR